MPQLNHVHEHIHSLELPSKHKILKCLHIWPTHWGIYSFKDTRVAFLRIGTQAPSANVYTQIFTSFPIWFFYCTWYKCSSSAPIELLSPNFQSRGIYFCLKGIDTSEALEDSEVYERKPLNMCSLYSIELCMISKTPSTTHDELLLCLCPWKRFH